MANFIMTFDNPNFNELIEDHELSALCFKSIIPTCIDNFLTSKKTRFMSTESLVFDGKLNLN